MGLYILGWALILTGLVLAVMIIVGVIRNIIVGKDNFDTSFYTTMFLMCVVYLLILTACIM